MAKIKRKEYEPEPPSKKDVVIGIFGLDLYFENIYSAISLINDLLLGILYLGGGLTYLFGGPPMLGNILYVLGAIFLIVRPLIKLLQSIYVYKENNSPIEEIEEEIKDETKDD